MHGNVQLQADGTIKNTSARLLKTAAFGFEDLPGERWRAVPGYAGRYEVSDRGRVRSLVSKWGPLMAPDLLDPSPGHGGYVWIRLTDGEGGKVDRGAHALVLSAFVGPCPDGMEACHRDGNPANNRLANLRWDTHQSNVDDTVRHGRVPRGDAHWTRRKVSP